MAMWTAICLTWLCCAQPAEATSPESPAAAAPEAVPTQQETLRLVGQLSSRVLAEREAAEQALVALGPGALPYLPADEPKLSAEVRERLARVRQKLELQRARDSAAASLVTLHVKNEPMSEVLSYLSQQTGNRFHDFREEFGQAPDNPEITLDCEAQPFWRALDDALDQAGLTIYGPGGDHQLNLIAREPSEFQRLDRACYFGAFRIAPLAVAAQRDLQVAERASLVVRLEVTWEPRLRLLGLVQRMSDVNVAGKLATDEFRPLRPADAAIELEPLLTTGVARTELELPLAAVPREVLSIGHLQGELTALIAGTTETFTFAALPEQPQHNAQRHGAVQVVLEHVRRNNDLWELHVRVEYDDASGALESHRTWIFDNEAYLLLPDGMRKSHDGFQTTQQSDRGVGVAFLFDRPEGLDGCQFVYRTPAAVLQIKVPYVLRDLPLP